MESDASTRIRSFWNSRATLGEVAGTNDVIAKQLEVAAIARHVQDGMRVLDVGCGNGTTAIELARRYDVEVIGFDFAEAMIAAAHDRCAGSPLKGKVSLFVGNALAMPVRLGRFDIALTERTLIDLEDWPTQAEGIRAVLGQVRDGGSYLMCENSVDGLGRLNRVRELVGLPAISPPWHNRYLRDAEVEPLRLPGAVLERVEDFTSTYAFLSRVVNASVAARLGVQPAYDARINKLALALPSLGRVGQTRLWVFPRPSHGKDSAR